MSRTLLVTGKIGPAFRSSRVAKGVIGGAFVQVAGNYDQVTAYARDYTRKTGCLESLLHIASIDLNGFGFDAIARD